MLYRIEGQWVELRLCVRPGAKRSEFAGLYGDEAFKVRIAARAVEGAANKALIGFLSDYFDVPKRSVTIVSGMTSRSKRVRIPLTKKLEAFIKSFEANA